MSFRPVIERVAVMAQRLYVDTPMDLRAGLAQIAKNAPAYNRSAAA